ncbi:MAG TPA: hypothetical protein ENN73_00700 [Firmicutes bacterium]|nr:hypothetical protein [Bacillota bacterium]
MKKLILIFILASVFSYSVLSDQLIFKVSVSSISEREYLSGNGLDLLGSEGSDTLIFLGDNSTFEVLDRVNFKYTHTPAVSFRIDSRYHSYSEVETILTNYELNYSSIAKVYDLGDAWEKTVGGDTYNSNYGSRDILALKISDNPGVNEDEPNILFMGAHHAREPLSAEVCLTIIDYLLTEYASNSDVRNWIDSNQIWVIPMVNPDGHNVVYTDHNIWWRKNTRDNNGNYSWAESGDGVDPNRNYGWYWGGTGSSPNPTNETYRGTAAFSEPETLAIKEFAEFYQPVFSVSYHTYGELVLYPFGYSSNAFIPDQDILSGIAVEIASRIQNQEGTGYYTPMKSAELYPATGDSDDWLYGELGCFSFTVEMAKQFIPAGSETVDGICNENLNGALYLFQRITGSGVTGKVYDSVTHLPLRAEVKVGQIDTSTLTPRYSDSEFGRYHRILNSGQYTIIVSSPGYETYTSQVISVGVFRVTHDVPLKLAGPEYISYSFTETIPENLYPEPGETGVISIILKAGDFNRYDLLNWEFNSSAGFMEILTSTGAIAGLGPGDTAAIPVDVEFYNNFEYENIPVSLTVSDTCGRTWVREFSVTAGDSIPPSITNLRPNGKISDPYAPISAVITDEGSGVNQDSISLTVNGKKISKAFLSFNPETGALNYKPDKTWKVGEQKFTVFSGDMLGNSTEVSETFYFSEHRMLIGDVKVIPNPVKSGNDSVKICFPFSRSGTSVKVRIFNNAGELVWERQGLTGNNYEDDYIVWPLVNKAGARAASGIYIAHIEITPAPETEPSVIIRKIAVIK